MRGAWLTLVVASCGFRPGAGVDAQALGDSRSPGDTGATTDSLESGDATDGPTTPIDGPLVPISFVQINSASAWRNAAQQGQVAFAEAQNAHDLGVVMVGWLGSNSVTMSDSRGNSYATAIAPTQHNGVTQVIYYDCDIAAAGANTNTVSVVFGAPAQFDVRIAEYSGLAQTACVDAAVGSSGSGSAVDSGPLTTTHAHDLLVATDCVAGETSGSDASYTERIETAFFDIVEDRTVDAPGTYDVTASEINSPGWVMQLIAFKGQ